MEPRSPHPNLKVTLRRATLADAPLLRRWDEQPHVIASDPHDEWGWEEELCKQPEWREQLIALVDDRPVGFVQVIDPALEDSHYWGESPPGLRAVDIWLGWESDLGKGYGTKIMTEVIERCFASSEVTAIIIDPLESNVRSHRFYERFGFEVQGPRRFGLDDCLVYRLNRQSWYDRMLFNGADPKNQLARNG